MHEFELGILKNVFKQLVWILHAIAPANVAKVNEQYVYLCALSTNSGGALYTDTQQTSFPSGCCRDDTKNCTSLWRYASGENVPSKSRFSTYVVQCVIPVFDGLFPDEHNASIRILLFCLAEWHALAKLWLHTEDSLKLLELSLKQLTTQLRRFVKVTCMAFKTKELPVEAAAWQQREKMQAKNLNSPHPKSFNLLTYKFHALGNYVQTIWLFGTTDSYTMQVVSTIHTGISSSSSLIPLWSGWTFAPSDQEIIWIYK